MPYLRQEFDKVLDLSENYECRDATEQTNSKLTSLIFNIPMQSPKENRHKRRSFLFQGRKDIEFCIFFMRGLTAKVLNTSHLKKREKNPSLQERYLHWGEKKAFTN